VNRAIEERIRREKNKGDLRVGKKLGIHFLKVLRRWGSQSAGWGKEGDPHETGGCGGEMIREAVKSSQKENKSKIKTRKGDPALGRNVLTLALRGGKKQGTEQEPKRGQRGSRERKNVKSKRRCRSPFS